MLSLSCVPVDTMQVIKWCVAGDCDNISSEMLELLQGATVRVIASYFGNVIVSIGDVRIALGKDIADRIKV